MAIILDVRKNEVGKVTLTWVMLALLAMGYAIGWSAIHAMLVSRLGTDYLPYSYIGISLLGLVGSSIYLLLEAHMRRDRLLILVAAVTGSLLLLSRTLVTAEAAADTTKLTPELFVFFGLVFAAQGLGNSTLTMQVWTIINEVFRPSQGQRLYPILTLAATFGGIVGGQAVQLVAPTGAANQVVVWAASVLLIIPLVVVFRRWYGGEMRGEIRSTQDHHRWAHLKEGFQFVGRTPFLHVMVAVSLFFWVVGSLQDFQYTRIMQATFPTEAGLSSFFGYYMMAFNLTALALQLSVIGRVLNRLGIGLGLAALPFVGLLGFVGIALSFTFWPGLGLRYGWDVVGMTLQGTAYQLSFQAAPGAMRGRVLAFIEGIVNPVGGALGGLATALLNHFGSGRPAGGWAILDPVTLAGIVCCAAWFLIVTTTRGRYLQAVTVNLASRDRRTSLDAIEALEGGRHPLLYQQLIPFLQRDDPDAQVVALGSLGRLGQLPALRSIVPLTTCADERVRTEAVRAIRQFRCIRRQPMLAFYFKRLMERLLSSDASYAVRAEAAQYLIEHHDPQNLPHFLRELLTHQDPVVRCQAVEALGRMGLQYIDFLLEEALTDADADVRARAVLALWTIPERQKEMNQAVQAMLGDADVKVQQAGLLVVARGGLEPYRDLAGNLLQSPVLRTRYLAGLAYLSAGGADQSMVDAALAPVLAVLGDDGVPDAARQEVANLLPELPGAGLDAVLVAAVQLSPEARACGGRPTQLPRAVAPSP